MANTIIWDDNKIPSEHEMILRIMALIKELGPMPEGDITYDKVIEYCVTLTYIAFRMNDSMSINMMFTAAGSLTFTNLMDEFKRKDK